ncbi:MAG: 4-hydroxy-tetrahydrodipicolinate synthase [Candidatus Helarchaeota archaeon]|nr:4-hydroxy-tetrahydrodipicolinate synthase [Candidatus Helarchaeota archaeon]
MPQVYTAIITPFQADGEIDYDLMGELMAWQWQSGMDGLVVCGTNGEFASLSFEEVKSLLKYALDRKKGDVEIIAGTGRASLKETIALCNFIEGSADKALVVPPFYFKELDPSGLYNYFERLLKATRIPIILYNIPKYTGVSITSQLLKKLEVHKNLVGVKDSSGAIENSEYIIQNHPTLKLYAGSDALIYSSLEKGAEGAISAVATSFPKDVLEIKSEFLAGKKTAAQAAQEKVSKIRSIIKQFPNRAAIKSALSLLGFPLSFVRPPLVNLTDEQQKDLKNKLSPYITR